MKRDYKKLNDLDKKSIRYIAGVRSVTYLLEGKKGLADLYDEFYQWTVEQSTNKLVTEDNKGNNK